MPLLILLIALQTPAVNKAEQLAQIARQIEKGTNAPATLRDLWIAKAVLHHEAGEEEPAVFSLAVALRIDPKSQIPASLEPLREKASPKTKPGFAIELKGAGFVVVDDLGIASVAEVQMPSSVARLPFVKAGVTPLPTGWQALFILDAHGNVLSGVRHLAAPPPPQPEPPSTVSHQANDIASIVAITGFVGLAISSGGLAVAVRQPQPDALVELAWLSGALTSAAVCAAGVGLVFF